MRPIILVLCLVFGLANARWYRRGRSSQPKETSFVGEATSQLSTAIFQGYIDDSNNIAFSPLGYSAILAILTEGAKGETKEQLLSALHLPKDENLTRKTYKYIMERLKNTNEYKYNQPELKNYFYIYKNYTINDDYKKILEDFYLTDVRSVEKYIPDHHFNDDDDQPAKDNSGSDYTKPIDTDKKETTVELLPPKEISEQTKEGEQLISFAVEDKPEKIDVTQGQYTAKNIKEKIKLVIVGDWWWLKTFPKKEYEGEDEETMVAVEARNHARSLKVLMNKDDITSSISVNSVGKSPKVSNSLMIIFNGMYFRGAWKKPFAKVEPGVFYQSSSSKRSVPMMKTKDTFKTALLPELDSEAIELPYDGGRYALLILVPRARDGLTRLIADLPSVPLADLTESLEEEDVEVSIPSFYLETTTKPVAALAKFGVSCIFNRGADLSGISSTEGLFVQELVQHVAVRVDNADTYANQLTAANPSVEKDAEEVALESLKSLPLSEKSYRKLSVEHPFVFYILDRLDNLIVVAGKVNDPQQPSSFDMKI